MIPSHTTVQLQLILDFIVHVQTHHLRGVQSVACTTKSSTASTTGESHVVGVVGIEESHHSHLVVEHSPHGACGVSVFSTHSGINIRERTLVHSLLDTEVEHCLLLAIVNTRHPCEVALFIVSLHPFNHGCRQVFHSSFGISSHKLLTIDKYFLHLLAVDGNLAVVTHLGTGEPLHQLFHYRPLGSAICSGIIYKCVFLQCHLCGIGSHSGTFEHDGISLHRHLSEGDVLSAHGDVL